MYQNVCTGNRAQLSAYNFSSLGHYFSSARIRSTRESNVFCLSVLLSTSHTSMGHVPGPLPKTHGIGPLFLREGSDEVRTRKEGPFPMISPPSRFIHSSRTSNPSPAPLLWSQGIMQVFHLPQDGFCF